MLSSARRCAAVSAMLLFACTSRGGFELDSHNPSAGGAGDPGVGPVGDIADGALGDGAGGDAAGGDVGFGDAMTPGDLATPGDTLAPTCIANADCAGVCIFGRCAQTSGALGPCDDPADCAAGNVCAGLTCRLVDGEPCTTDPQCLGDCVALMCTPSSVGDDWTWMYGSDLRGELGTYVNLGNADPAAVPGGRRPGTLLRDSSDNLWMFAGLGYDSTSANQYMSDLWRYDVALGQWAWMHGPTTGNGSGSYGMMGVSAPGNLPPPRTDAAGWIDDLNRIWISGGEDPNVDTYGDLWSWDPSSGEWTWVAGTMTLNGPASHGMLGVADPMNDPGSRTEACAWHWNDQLWLFGGINGSGQALNDLWSFDLMTGRWTWLHGSSTPSQAGTFGMRGLPAAANTPGARVGTYSGCAVDGQGRLWLFGGFGRSDTATIGYLADLWRYDTRTNQWTWLAGTAALDGAGTYGPMGAAGVSFLPPARSGHVLWLDDLDGVWLGHGWQGTGSYFNDVWFYDETRDAWTWVSGTNAVGTSGVYGMQGVPAPTNAPGARHGARFAREPGGGWMLGGFAYDAMGDRGSINDLWQVQVSR